MGSDTKRIVFTGGSGKAGRHIIHHLLSEGHTVLNLDLTPFPPSFIPPTTAPGQFSSMRCDLTDSGQVFNALSSLFNQLEYDRAARPPVADAVVHFAAYPRNHIVPDNETFRANMLSGYNVVEAACKLGVRKIVLASSTSTYGVAYTQGRDPPIDRFPCEEDTYDRNPADTYALSKLCVETVGRGFQKRYSDPRYPADATAPGVDVIALVVARIIEPHEYTAPTPEFDFVKTLGGVDGSVDSGRRDLWSYVDVRDLARIVQLCIQHPPGLGFQVFNAVNDRITVPLDVVEGATMNFLGGVCPDVEIHREIVDDDAPISNAKIKRVLGFREAFDWRREVEGLFHVRSRGDEG